jgi:hypothetical protein
MDEYQIVERVKHWYRTGSLEADHYFLLNGTTIISTESYEHSYERNPFINKQVTGYVNNDTTEFVSELEFPTLTKWYIISDAYLHKKGYVIRGYSPLGSAALPNLKYIIHSITSNMKDMSSTGYQFQDRLVIELVDLDVVANNLNLPKVMVSVLGSKLLSENNMIERDELDKINDRIISQKLFAGHTWYDAEHIVFRYFDNDERELSKEVLKISEAYERVFRPYRIMYDTKTWQPVLV